MRELALFAGAGGGILGGCLLGWTPVCAVEINTYAASVLLARQNDGSLPPFPIWDDVRTFDGTAWRGRVDMVSGGFPCQDVSCAGTGRGLHGERSGLWREMARIIREVQPTYVLVENSPELTRRGLGRVLGDLAESGYDAEWDVLGASDVGAPHRRKRLWILGYSNKGGCVPRIYTERKSKIEIDADNTSGNGRRTGKAWPVEPEMDRMVNGMAGRVDQVARLGEGQVPAVVKAVWGMLGKRVGEEITQRRDDGKGEGI